MGRLICRMFDGLQGRLHRWLFAGVKRRLAARLDAWLRRWFL